MKKIVRRGFTLPEILVTVTVVAVLAAVVVPAVTQYVNKGNAPATLGDLNEIRNGVNNFVADNRVYPTYVSDLVTAPANLTTSWKGPYTSATVAGATATSTFTSSGLGAILGSPFSTSSATGYLSIPITFASGTTCQVLWNLDKAIDGTSGSTADALTMSNSGALTWTGTNACDVSSSTTTGNNPGDPITGATIILRLMAIGK